MPRYIYIAKPQPNKTTQGYIEAESEQEAINKLTRMGYFPISIKDEITSISAKSLFVLRKISSKEVVLLTRQLSSLIESGVNILNSLNIIYNQTANQHLRAVISDIITKIKDGKSLSDSLATHKNLFPSFYISIIHSGEVSGNIDQALKRLADFLEKEDEFKSSISAALAYPIFVLVVGIITIMVLLGFVIPRLVVMFEDMGQILPLPTRILIAISGIVHSYGLLILAIIAVSLFFLRRLYLKPQGRFLWDDFKLKNLIWGQIVLKTEISRLMHTLSLLLSSGIPIINSLDISISVLNNQVIRLEAQKFKELITSGSSFSSCLKDSKLFPVLVTSVVSVGEETGNLEKSLMRIADEYEKDVDRTLKTFTRMLEPIIILVMGLIVGFIVMAMLLPIFQIDLMAR